MPGKILNHAESQNRSRSLWQFVLLLVILVAATVALAVTCLYPFISRSDYQISLYQGLLSEEQTPADTAAGSAVNSTASQLTGNQAQQFDFKVSDNQKVWSTDTTIELFQVSYQNKDGEITVRSADNNKVVAPGTGGSYTFSLKNASKLNSNYQVWLDADVSVGASGIPIEFRISGTDGWTDGKGEWLTADELNQAVARKNLYSGKSTEYTLYWRWAFERGEDLADTAYGNAELGTGNASGADMDVSQSISYRVTLHTLAAEGLIGESNPSSDITITPSGQKDSTDQNRNNSYINGNSPSVADSTGISRNPAKTADTTQIWKWILLLFGAALITVTVLGYRKNRENDDRTKTG